MEDDSFDNELYTGEEEEQLKNALELSKKQPSEKESISDILQDDKFLDSVLENLPGVNFKKDDKKEEEKKKEDENKDKKE